MKLLATSPLHAHALRRRANPALALAARSGAPHSRASRATVSALGAVWLAFATTVASVDASAGHARAPDTARP